MNLDACFRETFASLRLQLVAWYLFGVAGGISLAQGQEDTASATIVLSAPEQAWVEQHPTITVALDDANPPLNTRCPDGSYAGISVDYLRLITAKIGMRLELSGSSWNDALGRAMRHEVDAIMSASYKEDRLSALDFTAPYCETPEALVTRKDFPQINNLADCVGRRIAVVANTVRIPLLRQQVPQIEILEVANAGDGIRALAENRVDAFFDDLPVIQEQVDRMMAGHLRVALLYFQSDVGAQRIGVRNDAPLLRAILDHAIAAVTPEEHRTIHNRWLQLGEGAAIQRDLGLSDQERKWLSAHPVIRVACDPNWAPVEWRDGRGQWHGISIDYLNRFQRLLGIRLLIDPATTWQEALQHARGGKVDCIPSLAETPDRRRDWLFSTVYASFPIDIFARSEVGYLHDLRSLDGSRVAVVAGYAEAELLRRDCPGITLIPVASIHEAQSLVRDGKVVAYVGGLLPTAYHLQLDGDVSLHVAGDTPYSYHQAVAVRRDWPEFIGILNKALIAIPPDERETIWRQYVSLTDRRSTDLSLLWKAGLPLAVLLILFMYWNRRLSVEVRNRVRAENSLIAYRDRLEEQVRTRTADLESALGRLRRLAAAIEQTAEGIVLATQSGQIEFVNPAFIHITGIPETHAVGRNLGAIGLPWDERALLNGTWKGRIVGQRPDGVGFTLDGVASAVNDEQGRVIDVLIVLRDITSTRQIEERLAQAQKLEAVGTLAGGIAHDFNNILGAILGFTELAAKPNVSEDRRNIYLHRVVTACDRARSLIRQILTFARSTSGELKPIQFGPVLLEALELLRSSLPATIEIRQRIAPDVIVVGDATRLHQVIMNLGTNAGLAMPHGGILDIELSVAAKESVAQLVVRDQGVGMSPEIQARIFEPFFTTRSKSEGTGLGLSVVHGIIRDCGGTIAVTSAPGQGAAFTITLPLAHERVEASSSTESITMGQGQRILFVDDEADLRSLAIDNLSDLQYQVTVAADGVTALELLRSQPFDLLITDATMPRMTGTELITAARALLPNLRVILCSGQESGQHGTLPAQVRFLAKPVDLLTMAGAIRDQLAR